MLFLLKLAHVIILLFRSIIFSFFGKRHGSLWPTHYTPSASPPLMYSEPTQAIAIPRCSLGNVYLCHSDLSPSEYGYGHLISLGNDLAYLKFLRPFHFRSCYLHLFLLLINTY